MWVLFADQQEFDAWHEPIKVALGLPFDDGITTEYTKLVTSFDGRLVAWVDDDLATGLTETVEPTGSPIEWDTKQ